MRRGSWNLLQDLLRNQFCLAGGAQRNQGCSPVSVVGWPHGQGRDGRGHGLGVCVIWAVLGGLLGDHRPLGAGVTEIKCPVTQRPLSGSSSEQRALVGRGRLPAGNPEDPVGWEVAVLVAPRPGS